MYATFSSYDEVAHHSGLERADTLEALRKLDQQFGRIERARRYAARPYEIVVLSDHGQTQGATFKQRNGYGLADLVERSLSTGTRVAEVGGGDEQRPDGRHALGEATGQSAKQPKRAKNDVTVRAGRRARLGQPRARLPDGGAAPADARGDRGAPPAPASPRCASIRMSASCSCGRAEHGPVVLGRSGIRYLADDRVDGRRSARATSRRPPPAPPPHRRLRPRRRHHGQQLLRPAARRGLRVRGADLVPRRHGRAPDAAVRPPPGRALRSRDADRRRRGRPRRCSPAGGAS